MIIAISPCLRVPGSPRLRVLNRALVEFVVDFPDGFAGWSVADELALDRFRHFKHPDAGDLVMPVLLKPHEFFVHSGQVAGAFPGAEDVEGFDVVVPSAAGFVVRAGGGHLVAVGVGEEADFLVIDVVGVDGLVGVEGLAIVAQGNGDADIEATGLNQPAEDFEAFELGEVLGWGEVGIEASGDGIAQGIALLDGLEVGFAEVAAHDQPNAAFVVEEGPQPSGDLAEDSAVEEAGFAIVLGRAFEGRNVEVGDGVAGVAGVADFPGVGR